MVEGKTMSLEPHLYLGSSYGINCGKTKFLKGSLSPGKPLKVESNLLSQISTLHLLCLLLSRFLSFESEIIATLRNYSVKTLEYVYIIVVDDAINSLNYDKVFSLKTSS